MCKTKFLQMCSFSIIFNSLHSLNLSFPLLFYFIFTAIPKFPRWFSTSPPWFAAFFAFPPNSRARLVLINFVVVVVFINCSNSQQYLYSSHVCYNLGKNLNSDKILVTYTLVLTNAKGP